MRYTLPMTRTVTLKPFGTWIRGFFSELEHQGVQEPSRYSMSELALHRCVGFAPLPQRDNAAKRSY